MLTSEMTIASSDELMRQKLAKSGRDFGIYRDFMDAAKEAKARSIFPHFGEIEESDIIVDAGCGTGALAKLAAQIFRGAHVYAVDLSPDLIELATNEQSLIRLVYGNAAQQNFPDNSIKVKYFSTSGHEIESFGGSGSMEQAVEVTYRELVNDGKIVIRDFVKPSRKKPVYMKILTTDGFNDAKLATREGVLDYSLLSTRALFDRFHQEFAGGNSFRYESLNINGDEYIKLDLEWAQEFYLRKDYTANWLQEIQEKYTYWTQEEAEQNLRNAGFDNIEVLPEYNQYILENRLVGKIALYELDEKKQLNQIDFPPTHMVIVGHKSNSEDETERTSNVNIAVDYEERMNSVKIDLAEYTVSIDGQIFNISPNHPPELGSKRVVFRLADEPGEVLKVVRTEVPKMHGS